MRVLLVSGACGVGKSEVLPCLREALFAGGADAALLETDLFYRMIDPSWSQPPDRVERYYEITGWSLVQTALCFLRFGIGWVVIASNGFWEESTARRTAKWFLDEGARVFHVTLDPGVDVTCERMTRREGYGRWFADAEQLRTACKDDVLNVRAHAGGWTFVLDNASLTPAETAVEVLRAVERGEGELLAPLS